MSDSLEELLSAPTAEIIGEFLYDVAAVEEVSGDDDDDDESEELEILEDENGQEVGRRFVRRPRRRARRGRSRVKIYRKRPKAKLIKGPVGLGEMVVPANNTASFEVRPKIEIAPFKMELFANGGLNNDIFITDITRGQTSFLVNDKAPIQSFGADTTEPNLNYPVIDKSNSLELSFQNQAGFDVTITGTLRSVIAYKMIP